jgi:hypothetical protein
MLLEGYSLHRFQALNGQPIRGTGLMMAKQGRNNIVAYATAKNASGRESQIALKWAKVESENNNKAIDHERNCLRFFGGVLKIPGVVNVFEDGKLDGVGKNVLLMKRVYRHPSFTLNLNSEGVVHLAKETLRTLAGLNTFGVVHRNLHNQSVTLNTGAVSVGSMQYITLLDSASIASKTLAEQAGIGMPPRQPSSVKLPWFESQELGVKTDSLLAGCFFLGIMRRDPGFCRSGHSMDLSSLGDGSDPHLLHIISESVIEFNKFIAEDDPRLEMGVGLPAVVLALVQKRPESRISSVQALQELESLLFPNQVDFHEQILPARYVPELGEMMRARKIVRTPCKDNEGNTIDGLGLAAHGSYKRHDLIETYGGISVDMNHADVLTASNRGQNIKSIGSLHLVGGVVKGSILSLNWLGQHGAASLANANVVVSTNRDEHGERIVLIQPIEATAYWDIVYLPRMRRLPIPGGTWSNVVIALRAARDGSDGDQFFVDYGNGTTRAMFAVPGDRIIFRKRARTTA